LSIENDRDFVRALARGLSVIECFDSAHTAMTLSEVATRSNLSRGSARRLLLTLQRLGYVGNEGTRFRLHPRTLKLGYAYLSSQPVWNLARSFIDGVSRDTGLSCSIAILDGTDIVYVARAAAKRILNDYIAIGTRLPAFATSMGRVLLAGQSDAGLDDYFKTEKIISHTPFTNTDIAALRHIIALTRGRGWASNDQEIELGLRSIAVPIRDDGGNVVAAMNVSAQSLRVEMSVLEQTYLPVLREAADAVSALLAQI
jgi:IclR family pca regulon transcriptional regulator